MPDKTPEQEPSIEEILASIRQIITDDEEEPAPAKAAAPPPPPKKDVLELTDIVRDKPARVEEPIQVDLREAEEEPMPIIPPRRSEPLEEDEGDSILTDHAANAALSGFARLASRTPVERTTNIGGITLEDIVRDLMRPMLRDWLDQNLPPLIEKLVAKELEKLAREAREE